MPPSAPAARTRSKRSTRSSPRPTTRRGRAAHNALSHGLRSFLPVIPGVESEEDWLTHLAGVVQECAPVGQLEILRVDLHLLSCFDHVMFADETQPIDADDA